MYIKSVLGYTKRTIPLADIISWNEIFVQKDNFHKQKYQRYQYVNLGSTLTLYTKKRKYKIVELHYSNYPEIKEAVTKEKEQYIYLGGNLVSNLAYD